MVTLRLAAFAAAASLLLVLGTAMPVAAAPKAARTDASREASALDDAPVTLIEAITAAQQRTGGRAYDAGVQAGHGRTRIVVETSGPNGVQTVAVDAQSGEIVGSHAGGEPD